MVGVISWVWNQVTSILVLVFLLSHTASGTSNWVQAGSDLYGELANDEFGRAVALSSDGTVLAVGGHQNDAIGFNSGHIRVFEWSGTDWVQMGSDIDGVTNGQMGYSVDLSSDGEVLVAGMRGSGVGKVRAYSWNGYSWTQRGSDLNGETSSDFTGVAVSISSDGTVLAFGASLNDGTAANAGHVRVFNWSGTSWSQLGSDIDGEALGDLSGFSISLSSDGDVVAIGAPSNAGAGTNSGHVRVYYYNGFGWSQLGTDLNGESNQDESGYSVDLSSDGTVVAIGARYNNDGGSDSGQVRVYVWDGSTWSKRGTDIAGIAVSAHFGSAVALSSDGTIVAGGGVNYNGDAGSASGYTAVYTWSGSAWVLTGDIVQGKNAGDSSGVAVALSSSGSTLAVGEIGRDGTGTNTGGARVFTLVDLTPTGQPSMQPSSLPTLQPTRQPSGQPSRQPTSRPTTQPSGQPSKRPSRPSGQPTSQPTIQPSRQPSSGPTAQPTLQPSSRPSRKPSAQPSSVPSGQPSSHPSISPSSEPTVQPSSHPTSQPTCRPSAWPTGQPSRQPSSVPSTQPTSSPSGHPSRQPSSQPSRRPSSLVPTVLPTTHPTISPTSIPSQYPSSQPSSQPSQRPSGHPSDQPSLNPTAQPTLKPSGSPTSAPSAQPTGVPSCVPSGQPSEQPFGTPTSYPTGQPSGQPSFHPSSRPTANPSQQPTAQPSCEPTSRPSRQPSTVCPTGCPSSQPTAIPSGQPSFRPSSHPTDQPIQQPTSEPTCQPTSQPTSLPTCQQTIQPSSQPTNQPSRQPTCQPTNQPSSRPTSQPTCQPSTQPSCGPTSRSLSPSSIPDSATSRSPSVQPSTCRPTVRPSTLAPTVVLDAVSQIRVRSEINTTANATTESLPTITVPQQENAQGVTTVDIVVPVGNVGGVTVEVVVDIVAYNASAWNSGSSDPIVDSPVLDSNVLTVQVEVDGANISSFRPTFIANMSHLVGSTRTSSQFDDEAVYFRHNCSTGAAERVLFNCPDNSTQFNLTCYGTADISVIRVCPVLRRSCNVLSLSSFTITDRTYCEMVFTSRQFTICSCSDNDQRRLSDVVVASTENDDDENNGGGDGEGVTSSAVSVAVMSEYVATDFSSTLASSSSSFSGSDVAESSSVILYAMGSLWGVGVILMIVGLTWDSRVPKRKPVNDSAVVPMPSRVSIDVLNACRSFLTSVVPAIYSARPLLLRLLTELHERHVWCRAVRVVSGDPHVIVYPNIKSHSVRLALVLGEIVTTVTMSWFVLAMLFDLQFPSDDGSCGLWKASDACLGRTSLLDSSQTYCTWTRYRGRRSSLVVGRMIERSVVNELQRILSSDDIVLPPESDRFLCQYNDFSPSFLSTVIVTVVTSVIAGIFMNPIHSLFLACTAFSDRSSVQSDTTPKSCFRRCTQGLVHGPQSIIEFVVNANVLQMRSDIDVHFTAGEEEMQRRSDHVTKQDADHQPVAQFLHELAQQKQSLRSAPSQVQAAQFERSWERALHKERVKSSRVRSAVLPQTTNGEDVVEVATSFISTSESIAEDAARLVDPKHKNTTAVQGMIVILKFVSDLLGSTRDSTEARLFEHTLESDPSRQVLWVLPVWVRMLAMVVLVLMNVFAVYYTLLRGLQQGAAWQMTFVLACVAQTLSDVLFFQVIDVVFLHVMLPLLICKEVKEAVELLHQLLYDNVMRVLTTTNVYGNGALKADAIRSPECSVQSKLEQVPAGHIIGESKQQREQLSAASNYCLDATRYFFASSRLAREHWPGLWESAVVASYRSIWPIGLVRSGLQLERRWSESRRSIMSASTEDSEDIQGKAKPLLRLAMSMPLWVLYVIVRSVEPLLLTAVLLLWLFVQSNGVIAIVVFLALLCIAVVAAAWSSSRSVTQQHRIAVIPLPLLQVNPKADCKDIHDMSAGAISPVLPEGFLGETPFPHQIMDLIPGVEAAASVAVDNRRINEDGKSSSNGSEESDASDESFSSYDAGSSYGDHEHSYSSFALSSAVSSSSEDSDEN